MSDYWKKQEELERKKYTFDPNASREEAQRKCENPRGGHYWICHIYFTYGVCNQGDGTFNVWCKSHSPGWQGGGNDYEILFVPEKDVKLAEAFIKEIYRESDYNSTIYGHDVYGFRWFESMKNWRDLRYNTMLRSGKYNRLKKYVTRTEFFKSVESDNNPGRFMDSFYSTHRRFRQYPKSMASPEELENNPKMFYDDTKLKEAGFEIYTGRGLSYRAGQGRPVPQRSWNQVNLYASYFDRKELYQAVKKSVAAGKKLVSEWKSKLFWGYPQWIDDNMDLIVSQVKERRKNLVAVGPIEIMVMGGGRMMAIYL